MEYITRELERKFLKLNDFFKVILVTGARQVGKTTMLEAFSGQRQNLCHDGQRYGKRIGSERPGAVLPDLQAADPH